MSASCRLAAPASALASALALALACLAPVAAGATDDLVSAFSSGPTLIKLCGTDDAPIRPAACTDGGFDALAARLDKAFAATLSKAPQSARPLLKRDQIFFGEIVLSAAESMAQSDDAEDRQVFDAMLRQRFATLDGMAAGFGRSGVAGRWVSAFGDVVVTAADGGNYRLAIDMRSVYGADDNQRRECRVTVQVAPDPSGWLIGSIVAEHGKPATDAAQVAKSPPVKPPTIKLRRQGDTLRIVSSARELNDNETDCRDSGQITASYFADGKAETAATGDAAATGLVAPSFDCARPATASEEEICADPDLADNDLRLNRAWKALLPRLDEATRHALVEDQRGYVRAQAYQYQEFLHPGWEKRTYFMHYTGDARDKLGRLQRERIALLEGFDENRRGLVGVWLAHNAMLEVKPAGDGGLAARGWKWRQGDWKGGCEYEINGEVVNGVFQTYEKRKNPDTLERDHATLIVNRKDDMFANKRGQSDDADDADEPKCKRSASISSTARLFPARPSPDIDDLGGSFR